MFGLIEGLLALVGFIALLVIVGLWFAIWLNEQVDGPATEEDHDPYVDALATAARISAQGYEAERLIHALGQQATHDEDGRS